MTKITMRPVLWIDLDGTIRHHKNKPERFIHKAEDVAIYLGVPEILAGYKRSGWRIVGISNQGGVAMGFLSMDDLSSNIKRTQELVGNAFDSISVCTHHPNAKKFDMRNCWCRKPRIGALVQAGIELANKYQEYYPPDLGYFVGDKPEDEQCAANAGLRFMPAEKWRNLGGMLKKLEIIK